MYETILIKAFESFLYCFQCLYFVINMYVNRHFLLYKLLCFCYISELSEYKLVVES